MKKHIIIFATVLFISGCAEKKSGVHRNDLFFDNLKGEVEMVKEIPYTVDENGKIGSADSCCISILEFDNKGYRTLQLYQDASGKELNGQMYTKRYENGFVKELRFTVNGKTLSILSGTLDGNGKYGSARIFDSSGKLISFYADIEVNDYDKIISWKSFKPDSTLQQTIINNYNQHIWVGGSVKDSSGKEISSTVIKPDENMNPMEVVQTQLINGVPLTTIVRYEYELFDEHSNWILRREVDEKGNIRKILKREIHYRLE